MDEKALLEAIGQMMDERLKPIQADIAEIKEDLAELKEEHGYTREGVNKLLEWSENAGYIIHYPLDKAK